MLTTESSPAPSMHLPSPSRHSPTLPPHSPLQWITRSTITIKFRLTVTRPNHLELYILVFRKLCHLQHQRIYRCLADTIRHRWSAASCPKTRSCQTAYGGAEHVCGLNQWRNGSLYTQRLAGMPS